MSLLPGRLPSESRAQRAAAAVDVDEFSKHMSLAVHQFLSGDSDALLDAGSEEETDFAVHTPLGSAEKGASALATRFGHSNADPAADCTYMVNTPAVPFQGYAATPASDACDGEQWSEATTPEPIDAAKALRNLDSAFKEQMLIARGLYQSQFGTTTGFVPDVSIQAAMQIISRMLVEVLSAQKSRPGAESRPPGVFTGSDGAPALSRPDKQVNPNGKIAVRKEKREKTQQGTSSGTLKSDTLITTVMLRNLPKDMVQNDVIAALDQEGFSDKYNFVYAPCSFETREGKGYAFINFNLPSQAEAFKARAHQRKQFGGFQADEGTFLSVAPASVQGLEANLMQLASGRLSRIKKSSNLPFVKPACFSPPAQAPQKAPSRTAIRLSEVV